MKKRTKAQELAKEKQKNYWKQWVEEENMTVLFLLSGGYPKDKLTGKIVTKPRSGRLERTDASVHHLIMRNGNRVRGRVNRIVAWKKDMPILQLVSKNSHDFIHETETPQNELLGMNALLTGDLA